MGTKDWKSGMLRLILMFSSGFVHRVYDYQAPEGIQSFFLTHSLFKLGKLFLILALLSQEKAQTTSK